MSQLSKKSNQTKLIAVVAIFSALYTVLRLLQTIPMIGIEGGRFSLSDMIAPIYGVILGPYVGGASVIFGSFLAIALGRPVSFMFLDFLPAFVNCVALGFLMKRKWLPVVALNALLLVIFMVNPLTTVFINVGGVAIPFAWLHIVAFAVLVSPLGYKAGGWVESLRSTRLTAGLGILAFVGTMMQHLTGNILTEVVRGQIMGVMTPASFDLMWNAVFFVYPWERLMLIILAVVVGVPLVRVLKKSFFSSPTLSTKTSTPQ
ncbi:MAG: hypothetical protein N3D85_05555 [Candidatus Bathyarchaeota archaeon]|nr:hypothetical protein [Candidatus Bathyarchaeota archaeon]